MEYRARLHRARARGRGDRDANEKNHICSPGLSGIWSFPGESLGRTYLFSLVAFMKYIPDAIKQAGFLFFAILLLILITVCLWIKRIVLRGQNDGEK